MPDDNEWCALRLSSCKKNPTNLKNHLERYHDEQFCTFKKLDTDNKMSKRQGKHTVNFDLMLFK